MRHAEVCPVCNGSGKVPGIYGSIAPGDLVPCHGCGGKGWVAVNDYVYPVNDDEIFIDKQFMPIDGSYDPCTGVFRGKYKS